MILWVLEDAMSKAGYVSPSWGARESEKDDTGLRKYLGYDWDKFLLGYDWDKFLYRIWILHAIYGQLYRGQCPDCYPLHLGGTWGIGRQPEPKPCSTSLEGTRNVPTWVEAVLRCSGNTGSIGLTVRMYSISFLTLAGISGKDWQTFRFRIPTVHGPEDLGVFRNHSFS